MPQQRPFFLSSFIAAFRQQGPSSIPPSSSAQQPNKHTPQASASAAQSSSSTSNTASTASASATTSTPSAPRSISTAAAAAAARHQHHTTNPIQSPTARRRGSDSSSEGFRDVIGADKWYIGGRTAAGDERFFKLGVVRRVRSNDGLSLDRLSL